MSRTSTVIHSSYIDPLGAVRSVEFKGSLSAHTPARPWEPGNFEPARHGPGQSYHIHVRDVRASELELSSETWKPWAGSTIASAIVARPIQAASQGNLLG